MNASNEKSTAALLHLSTLSQYIIPLGNYIFPIIIWTARKNESEFIDKNGKQVLNFQLSLLLYTLVLSLIAVPVLVYSFFKNLPFEGSFSDSNFEIEHINPENISGFVMLAIAAVIVFGFVKIIEFILIIYGAVKASNGDPYKYPLSIQFFK